MGQLSAIAQFADPEEAYCAKGFLRARGIDCIIQNDHHLTMAPWLRVALGGYRLMVIDAFADDAKAALEEVDALNSDDDLAQHAQQGNDFGGQKRKAKNWLWFPVAFLSAVPFLPSRKHGLIGVFQFLVLVSLYTGLVFVVGFQLAN